MIVVSGGLLQRMENSISLTNIEKTIAGNTLEIVDKDTPENTKGSMSIDIVFPKDYDWEGDTVGTLKIYDGNLKQTIVYDDVPLYICRDSSIYADIDIYKLELHLSIMGNRLWLRTSEPYFEGTSNKIKL